MFGDTRVQIYQITPMSRSLLFKIIALFLRHEDWIVNLFFFSKFLLIMRVRLFSILLICVGVTGETDYEYMVCCDLWKLKVNDFLHICYVTTLGDRIFFL